MEQSQRVVEQSAQSVVLVWDDGIPSLAQLEAEADAEDMASVEGISSESRRRERLAWRQLARTLIACRSLHVEYTQQGAPQIKDFPYSHISVSHCRGVVAVVASQRRCGVDVERCDRNFRGVESRYISAEEWRLCVSEDEQQRNLFRGVVWCAKETLYKMYGEPGMELCGDIAIEAIDFDACSVVGRVAQRPSVEMRFELRAEYMLVYHC